MTVPGVGAVVALTYRATVDVPARFQNSKAFGAVFGLTLQVSIGRERPNRRDITVRRRDDAGNALRSDPDPIGALGEMVLAQGLGNEDCHAHGLKKAIVALARRLAVIMPA
jgi:transposase